MSFWAQRAGQEQSRGMAWCLLMAKVNWAAAAVLLGFTTSTPAADEPTVLSDLELDAITAAGVLVDVNSFATARGGLALSRTDSDTFVLGGKTFDLGVGRTMGLAFACCNEEAEVVVGSGVVGLGDIAHSITHSVEHDGRFLDVALSAGFVLALSVKRHFAAAWPEHVAILEQLRAALADFHLEFSDAVMVGAQ
jgi:hypothetical protein